MRSEKLATKKDIQNTENNLRKDFKVDLKKTESNIRKDFKVDLDNLETNIQKDILTLGEVIIKEIRSTVSSLADRDYVDRKISDADSNNVRRYKNITKSSKHVMAIVGRHHNKAKQDQNDMKIAQQTLKST